MAFDPPPAGTERSLLWRISRLEWIAAGIAVVVFAGLVVADRDIVRAPAESPRAILAVVVGTILAAGALLVMLRLGVPPIARVIVLAVPLVLTSWWLVSPFFRDTVVHDEFSTSIAAARERTTTTTSPVPPGPAAASPPPVSTTVPATLPPAPRLLGSGSFVGLAGHHGTGLGGIFELPDGSRVLRLEAFDIDNGPDLELHLVPGADRRSPAAGAHHFGALRGNVGEQTYAIPAELALTPGPWTVLVWCEAFTVEFVAATLTVG